MYFDIFFYILSVILTFFLYYILYTWTKTLEKEKCECSNSWERKFINIGTIILPILSLILSIINLFKPYKYIFYIMIYTLLLSLIAFIFYIILFMYIYKLKKMECKCSDSWKREFGYIYSIIIIITDLSIFIYLGFLMISFGKIISYI